MSHRIVSRALAPLSVTLGVLALAALLKWPCLHHPWDGFQYASLCYSDIAALYHVRGIADGVVPYVEGFSEYPVLTGLWTWVAGSLSDDMSGYFWLNAAFLGAGALLVTFLVAREDTGPRVWVWAAAPSLLFSAFLNFDLFAVALATVAVVLFRRGAVWWSAVFFGLGAAAKLYPAFLVPLFAAALWRSAGAKQGIGFAALSAGVFTAIQVPFLLISPQLWWETYSFHGGRGQEWETLWMVLAHLGRTQDWAWTGDVVTPDVMAWVSRVALVAGVGVATWGVFRRTVSPERASLVVLVVFFLTSPVFNMQYVLWILPFLVLVRVPWLWIGLLFLGDVAVHLTKFHLLLHIGTPLYDDHFTVFAVALLVRIAAFLGILVWSVRPVGLDLTSRVRSTLRDRRTAAEGG